MKIILIRSKTNDSAIFKVAETLYKNGYEIHLLVWDRQNNLNVGDYPFKITKFGLKASYDKFSLLLYLPFWWIYEFYFLLKNNYDIVHASDLDTLFPAIITKPIKKNKLFYTIYDLYAYVVSNGSFQEIRNLIRSFLWHMELYGIKYTDTLFLVDESRYNEVKGAKINNISYIYNSPLDYFQENKPNSRNDLKIFYGGSISKERGIDHVLEAIKDLNDVKLIVAGDGDKKIIHKINNANSTEFLGWLPYNDLITKTLDSDIIFRFSDPNNPRTKTASPNKLFEAMMCGKPIIMNSEMGISNIVLKEECGILVPYEDIDTLKDTIIMLKDDNLRNELGLNGRKAYENKYNWKIMEKRLLNAYKDLNEDYHVK
jgi:glycosyltransferase involved in cell wall biosynthesis